MTPRLPDPTPQDYADALVLQHVADRAGIGLAVLFAMTLRALRCGVGRVPRADPRIVPDRPA